MKLDKGVEILKRFRKFIFQRIDKDSQQDLEIVPRFYIFFFFFVFRFLFSRFVLKSPISFHTDIRSLPLFYVTLLRFITNGLSTDVVANVLRRLFIRIINCSLSKVRLKCEFLLWFKVFFNGSGEKFL